MVWEAGLEGPLRALWVRELFMAIIAVAHSGIRARLRARRLVALVLDVSQCLMNAPSAAGKPRLVQPYTNEHYPVSRRT